MTGPVTLGDLARDGKLLWVYCRDCCHERDVTPASVPLPGDTPVPDVGKRMKCSKCGSKERDHHARAISGWRDRHAGATRYRGGDFLARCFKTPKSPDCAPSVDTLPVTVSPRRSTSRKAAARLGMRCLKRNSSMAASSSADSIICTRSPRSRSAIPSPTKVSGWLLYRP